MTSSGDRDARFVEAARQFAAGIDALRDALDGLNEQHVQAMTQLVKAVAESWQQGGKLLICGNGGSAADSQHIAAELVGRFQQERMALPALALTTDTSIITSVGNDYGFEEIFARQVEGLGRPGDVLLVISTSGNSPNCVQAVAAARRQGMTVFGFLGGDGGALVNLVDTALIAPSSSTPEIQEIHITCGHLLCRMLDKLPPPTGSSDGAHDADG
jgi:D-sedoheptulose 7-phosphate isomerase